MELCAGQRSVNEIARAISAALGLDNDSASGDVLDDVSQTLSELQRNGLIVLEDAPVTESA